MKVKAPKPPVVWNGDSFVICLPYPDDQPDREWMEVAVKPRVTYVVRVRELGAKEWLIGIETPLTSCSFNELKPDTDYEVEVRARNEAGESEPAVATCHTGPDGSVNPISMADA